MNGRDLWRLTVYGSNELDVRSVNPDTVLRRMMGKGFEYSTNSVSLWTRGSMVAKRFQRGRVFIVGDAAHTHAPNGGFGMNTGIMDSDSQNLGWKLAARLAGWGGDRLLTSYESERRSVCIRAVNASELEYRRLTACPKLQSIEQADANGEEARATVGAFLDQEASKGWQRPGITLGYSYAGSPIVVGDASDLPADDLRTYVPNSRPGARAPHGWLADKRSTLDLFGGRFALLRFGASNPDVTALLTAAEQRGVPVEVTDIEDEKLERLYGSRLVLVRPDGHVAWRAESVVPDPMSIIDKVRGAVH